MAGVVGEDEEGSFHVRSDWVVDASGPAGLVAARLGLKRRAEARTVAVAGYWRGSRLPDGFPAENTLFEMRPDGWIWSVLRRDGLRNVTLGVDASRVKDVLRIPSPDAGMSRVEDALRAPSSVAGMSRAEDGVLSALYHREVTASDRIGPLIADAERIGSLTTHESTPSWSERYAGAGWISAGDAASFIDPLTSQGVYKALQSGIIAASVVNTVRARPEDLDGVLDFYQRSQARFFAGYASVAATFYRASPYADRPFWRARLAPDQARPEWDPDEAEARRARRASMQELLRSIEGRSARLSLSPGVEVRPWPNVEGGFVVRRPSFVVSDRDVAVETPGVDPEQLGTLLDGRTLAEVFDDYARTTETAPSSELGRALTRALLSLAEEGVLTMRKSSEHDTLEVTGLGGRSKMFLTARRAPGTRYSR